MPEDNQLGTGTPLQQKVREERAQLSRSIQLLKRTGLIVVENDGRVLTRWGQELRDEGFGYQRQTGSRGMGGLEK